MNIGSLEAGGNVNLNEAGRDIKQITITGKIDFDILKLILEKESPHDLPKIEPQLDSLKQAVADKNEPKTAKVLTGFLLDTGSKVVQGILIRWIAGILIQ